MSLHVARCPTCAQRVTIGGDDDEGTHYYVGLDALDEAAIRGMWNDLIGALHVALDRPGEGLTDDELVAAVAMQRVTLDIVRTQVQEHGSVWPQGAMNRIKTALSMKVRP